MIFLYVVDHSYIVYNNCISSGYEGVKNEKTRNEKHFFPFKV